MCNNSDISISYTFTLLHILEPITDEPCTMHVYMLRSQMASAGKTKDPMSSEGGEHVQPFDSFHEGGLRQHWSINA